MVCCIENHMVASSNERSMMNSLCTREKTLQIILVDSHLLMRQALQRVVAALPHTLIAGSTSCIQDAYRAIDGTVEYTIVLGPSILVSDCLALMKQLRARQAPCHVVSIQQSFQPEMIRILIEQKVLGLLDEQASEQDLAQAIHAASLHHTFLSKHVHAELTTSMTRTVNHLTAREIQVLSRLQCGESNFRIARFLGLKEKTIEKYLTSIYEKLNVSSRAEAILCLQKVHF